MATDRAKSRGTRAKPKQPRSGTRRAARPDKATQATKTAKARKAAQAAPPAADSRPAIRVVPRSASTSARARTSEPRISDAAVRAATGKTWRQWFALLDRAGAGPWPHREIARLLHDQHDCSLWWSQMVTVGYEQARGRRVTHQSPEGFRAGKSMTFEVPVAKLFQAWNDPALRARWLGEPDIEVSTATAPKSIRFRWSDGATRVAVGFVAKGRQRSAAQLEHEKLADRAAVDRVKAYWEERLARLKRMLEG